MFQVWDHGGEDTTRGMDLFCADRSGCLPVLLVENGTSGSLPMSVSEGRKHLGRIDA